MSRQRSTRSREGSVGAPRSLSWPILALTVVALSALWSYAQIVLVPILPYFFMLWWVASAAVQFLIGRFAARRAQLTPRGKAHISLQTLAAGILLMLASYAVAQIIVPLLVIRMPMIQAKTPLVPPLLIEIIIAAAAVAGYVMTLQPRVAQP